MIFHTVLPYDLIESIKKSNRTAPSVYITLILTSLWSIATEHLNHDSEQSQRTLKKEVELDEIIEKLEGVIGDIYEFEQIMKIITDEE